MKDFLNNFIYKIKNIYTLFRIMYQYSDIVDRDYFLNIIDNDIKRVNNIFYDTEEYDFNYRILKLNELKKVLNDLSKRNDFELVKKGYSIYKVLDHYKKEHLFVIINSILYLNPIYDIIKLDISDDKLNLSIDSWVNPNTMIEILDTIYHTDHIISYQIKKLYSKNRIGYDIEIKSDLLYDALKYFLLDLNDKIRDYISPIIMNLREEQKIQLYRYINNFYINIDILENLEFGNKEDILSIIKSNYRLIKSIETKVKY